MTDNNSEDDWMAAAHAAGSAQARAVKEQAHEGGLRFEAYLPPNLAEWVLDLVARGVFTDPSEAVFVILGEHKDLEPHADLRQELLRRRLGAAMDDPRPPISSEEVEKRFEELRTRPKPRPIIWQKYSVPNSAKLQNPRLLGGPETRLCGRQLILA
jgi:antitoxin ParD1/3/4